MKRAIFLDRDGTINKDLGYLHEIENFEFEINALKGLKKMAQLGYLIFVVTSQSGIARGYYSEDDYFRLEGWMEQRLLEEEVKISKSYFCPHHPKKAKIKKYLKNCNCRKPKPGMLLAGAREFNLDLAKSWMIGDKTSDILAGKNAGCRTIMVKTGQGGKDGKYEVKPDFIAQDLLAAAEIILDEQD